MKMEKCILDSIAPPGTAAVALANVSYYMHGNQSSNTVTYTTLILDKVI